MPGSVWKGTEGSGVYLWKTPEGNRNGQKRGEGTGSVEKELEA